MQSERAEHQFSPFSASFGAPLPFRSDHTISRGSVSNQSYQLRTNQSVHPPGTWDVAARHLPLPPEQVQAYRDALVERFTNPAIRHLLAQIAADGSQKIPIRFVPAIKADLAQGVLPSGATRAIAAWTLHLRGLGVPVNDFRADEVLPLGEGTLEESVGKVLAYLGVDDQSIADEVLRQAVEIRQLAGLA